MGAIWTILFGLLSAIALLAAISYFTGNHAISSLIACLLSLISITVSCYFWTLVLEDSGKQAALLGYSRYPFVLYLVSAIVIVNLFLLVYSLILMRCQTLSPKMKRGMILAVVCIMLLYAMTVGALTRNNSIVGTWYGDGTFEVPHTYFPLEHATHLVFRLDGTVLVETVDDDGNILSEEYPYDLTSDTISIQEGDLGYGILFDVKGDELHFGRDGAFGVYHRK